MCVIGCLLVRWVIVVSMYICWCYVVKFMFVCVWNCCVNVWWFMFVLVVIWLRLVLIDGVVNRWWYIFVSCVLVGSGVCSERCGIVVIFVISRFISLFVWLLMLYIVGRLIVLLSSCCSSGDMLYMLYWVGRLVVCVVLMDMNVLSIVIGLVIVILCCMLVGI